VKEGLEETLRLLRGLPPVEAPPELLEGVRRRIAQEGSPATPLWKKLFLPAHIKIPLEAAAAVLLFLLVYGAQKEELQKPLPPPPAARTAAAPETEKAKEAGPGDRPVTREDAGTGTAARSGQPSLPVVPAQRVSTAGERIEPPPRQVLFGRDVTIEVDASSRPGLEDRIAAAALRLGGNVRVEPAKPGIAPEGTADIVHVRLPADSENPFLAELSKLGTLPEEGMSGRAGLAAPPPAEAVAYRVRIRVR
jgi:hypothetical protein